MPSPRLCTKSSVCLPARRQPCPPRVASWLPSNALTAQRNSRLDRSCAAGLKNGRGRHFVGHWLEGLSEFSPSVPRQAEKWTRAAPVLGCQSRGVGMLKFRLSSVCFLIVQSLPKVQIFVEFPALFKSLQTLPRFRRFQSMKTPPPQLCYSCWSARSSCPRSQMTNADAAGLLACC